MSLQGGRDLLIVETNGKPVVRSLLPGGLGQGIRAKPGNTAIHPTETVADPYRSERPLDPPHTSNLNGALTLLQSPLTPPLLSAPATPCAVDDNGSPVLWLSTSRFIPAGPIKVPERGDPATDESVDCAVDDLSGSEDFEGGFYFLCESDYSIAC